MRQKQKKNLGYGFLIVFAIVLLIVLISNLTKQNSITFYRDVEELGKVTYTLIPSSRPFTITWLQTQVFQNEQADLRDYWQLGSGVCNIDYWKISIERTDPNYHNFGEVDVTNEANKISADPCRFEVFVSFVTSDIGTYSAGGRFKQVGQSEREIFATNFLQVTSNPNLLYCEWQPWEFFQSIQGGHIEWRYYKDLNTADGIPCDLPSEYKTYCDSGYHIKGTQYDTVSDGIKECTLDEQECKQEGQSCGYIDGANPECCSGLDCQFFQCILTGRCSPENSEKCGSIADPDTQGDVLYKCFDGTWKSQGKIEGKCGYGGGGDNGDSEDNGNGGNDGGSEEESFLKKYWLPLLILSVALVLIVIVAFIPSKKKNGGKSKHGG